MRSVKVIRTALLVFLSLLAVAALPAQAACMRIGIPTGGANIDDVTKLVQTIFDRAGLCVKMSRAPQQRLNVMEEKDEIDGDAWRDDSFLANHPSMIKVPTPISNFSGSLYWLRGREDPSESAEATIGILLGRAWPRDALKGLPGSFFEGSSYQQLYEMTRTGRLHGFVMSTQVYQEMFASQEKNGDRFASREVRRVPLYLAVRARWSETVPALDKAVKSVMADGTAEYLLHAKPRVSR
jgi:hypothetical protein